MAVMMSSVMPSAKYSCSGSPLMLVNGSTASEGLSGRGSTGADDGDATLKARTGWADVLHPLFALIDKVRVDLAPHGSMHCV